MSPCRSLFSLYLYIYLPTVLSLPLFLEAFLTSSLSTRTCIEPLQYSFRVHLQLSCLNYIYTCIASLLRHQSKPRLTHRVSHLRDQISHSDLLCSQNRSTNHTPDTVQLCRSAYHDLRPRSTGDSPARPPDCLPLLHLLHLPAQNLIAGITDIIRVSLRHGKQHKKVPLTAQHPLV